ncbi:FG-GAP-like repeat-containing protein [Rhodopirellula sp. P2]|uniref:FG-GAP-like repeat-containing protein n=1 Tax=Rhodopirellula sp. P2 TaxID=2127060 RepID=UPI00236883ED|nr:FG-GAP-like repeat-containing protein [Rhodopirellula sp. P2]WDQ17928.1 FG-GAP-like repeat-containing protein [Rhodopirellula sp. P2]
MQPLILLTNFAKATFTRQTAFNRRWGVWCLALLCLCCWIGCKPSTPANPVVPKGEPRSVVNEPLSLREQIAQQVRDGRPAEAIKLLDELIATKPADEIALASQAASLAFEAGDASEAMRRLREWIQAHPQNVELRRDYAGLLAQRGYRFDANEQYRLLAGRVVLSPPELIGLIYPHRPQVNFESKPDIADRDAVARKGVLSVVAALRSRGDLQEAIDVLTTSDEVKRNDPAAVAMLGWLYASAQQESRWIDWAIVTDAKRLRRYPAFWLSWGTAMRDRVLSSQTDLKQADLRRRNDFAARCFLEAIRREPHSQVAWDSLSATLEVLDAESKAGSASEGSLEDSRERLSERLLQLDETQWLANQLWNAQSNPLSAEEQAEMFDRLADMLWKQGCLGESLGWKTLLASMHPIKDWSTLRRTTQETFTKHPQGIDERVLLVGLEPKQFADQSSVWMEALARRSRGETPADKAPPTSIESTQARLVNVASEVGIHFQWFNAIAPVESEFRLHEPLGGGVACLDFDADGRIDFYFNQAAGEATTHSGVKPNALYRQLDGKFTDVVMASMSDDRGYGHGVTAGDWNQDGWPDLLLANFGENVLLINQADGTFQKRLVSDLDGTASAAPNAFTLSAAIADVTGDHLPDLISIQYIDDPEVLKPIERKPDGSPVKLPGPLHFQPAFSEVLVSDGKGAGESLPLSDQDHGPSTGMGLMVADLDAQPGNEIFVSNDQRANHFWFRTHGEEGMTAWSNQAAIRGVAVGPGGDLNACMGIAMADFNRDQKLDLHVSNFYDEWANHFCQTNAGMFVDRAVVFGVDRLTSRMTGFGVQALDYDNNGWDDLLVANGHVEDLKDRGTPFQMKTQLLVNRGQRLEAAEMDDPKGDWERARLGRGVATCDFNRDGRLDAVVTYVDAAAELLRNETESVGNFLQLRLIGTQSERDAIGARVEVKTGEEVWVGMVAAGDGYACRNEAILHFGLGDVATLDSITVRWPTGEVQRWEANESKPIDVNQRIGIVEGFAGPFEDR